MTICDTTSDPSARRLHYVSLKQELENLRSTTTELTLEAVQEANRILREAIDVPQDGATPQDLKLLIDVEKEVLDFYQETLPTLTVTNELTIDAFVNNVRQEVDRVGWGQAMDPFDFLRCSVTFQTLNVARDETATQSAPKEKRPAVRRAKQVLSEATQPTQVGLSSQGDVKNVHSDHVYKALVKRFRESSAALPFWPFVLDPHSFENTVQNMFAVNILVNNGNVKLIAEKGSDNRYLEPVDGPQRKYKNSEKKQYFLSIDPQLYKDLLRKLKISEAAIPR